MNYAPGETALVLMLNSGVNINAMDINGKTAANLLIPQEPADLENLEEFKSNPDSTLKDGRIKATIIWMVTRGATPNIKAKDGYSVIDICIEFRRSTKDSDHASL